MSISFATPWTVAHQAPLSMGFSRQEYQSGLPFLSPGDFPDPGMETESPFGRQILYCWATWEAPWKAFLGPKWTLCWWGFLFSPFLCWHPLLLNHPSPSLLSLVFTFPPLALLLFSISSFPLPFHFEFFLLSWQSLIWIYLIIIMFNTFAWFICHPYIFFAMF